MTVAIGLGLAACPFTTGDEYWQWVDVCEAGGVDSLWQTDRLVGPETMLETLSVMAALAGRTRRIKFGMNVVSLAFRDPMLLAKQCATIDFLSGGRLLPAFGIGSPHAPEWDMLGCNRKTRGRRTDEALEIIARLWREPQVSYQGQHFQLHDVVLTPKPVQSQLPMWIGGSSPAAIKRTAHVGTGWIAGPETAAQTQPIVAAIHEAAAAAGRTIDRDHFGASFPFYFGAPDASVLQPAYDAYHKRTGNRPQDYFAVGDADAILAHIDGYVAAGVSKFILRPLGASSDEVLAQTEQLVDDVLPHITRRYASTDGAQPRASSP